MILRRLLRACELPLLVKELNEQSARPRTYVVRFLYAATLFTAACTLFYGNLSGDDERGSASLGRGRFMFESLVTFQFWCIYLFLPAISCNALTVEKERNSLGLLLITSLRPWQIVVQKLLGRVVPMLTFVLLSFPLMAIAYSFGGVTEDYLWSGTLLLVLTCFQVGALSIACSAYFPSTVEAFAANYVIFVVLYWILPPAWGPWLFERADRWSFAATLTFSSLMLMLTGGFLTAGWMALEPRAFVPPKNALLGLFKKLDAFFNDLNKVTGGVILVPDGYPLPRGRPVAWRETAKKSLGTFRYLFRVLVFCELPLLAICSSMELGGPGGADLRHVTGYLYVFWLLSVAMIVIHAGSLISSERTRQTLDVLLTTPLTGRDLILQKLQGVRRLIGVLLVPFLTVFVFETWWNQGATFRWLYLPLALASLCVYLSLIVWISLCAGLLVRSQIKAVLAAASLIGGWLLVPSVISRVFVDLFGIDSEGWLRYVLLLNPAALVPELEAIGALQMPPPGSAQYAAAMPPWLAFPLNLLLHAGLLYALRRWCLNNADRLLGRLGEIPEPKREWEPSHRVSAPIEQLAT